MIEGMSKSMDNIEVMDNDDWLGTQQYELVACPTQKHPQKKLGQIMESLHLGTTTTSYATHFATLN